MSKVCQNCRARSTARCVACKDVYVCSDECWNRIKYSHKKVCSRIYEPIGHHMEGEKKKNKITATGEHTIRSAPDTVAITFTITAQYNEVYDTQGAVRTKYETVIKGKVMKKFPQLVVERTSYSVQPVMEYPKDQRPRRVGFKASQSVTFSTQDLKIAGSVIQEATGIDESEIEEGGAVLLVDGVDFYLKDDDAAEMEALRMATKKARAKIEAMAAAAGVDTWTISSIDEDGYSRPRTIHYESARALSAAPSSQREATTTLTPGVIETRKTVRMEALI